MCVVTALIGDVTVSVVGDVFLVEFACGTTMDTMDDMDDAFACGTTNTTMMTLQCLRGRLPLSNSNTVLCNGMNGRLLLH